MPNADANDTSDLSRFRIFRAEAAPDLVEAACMTVEPYSEVQRAGMDKLVGAGYLDGSEIAVLVDIPGFNLTHVWFKEGYPLPLHSHNADCLYYVIAGSIRLGNESLGPRDSIFIPAGAPYTFKPGPDGVEFLEFRHQGKFNFVNLAKGAAFWERAARQVAEHHEGWETARPPRLD